jgi:malonyl CoA-acyl carrier protein transacylase
MIEIKEYVLKSYLFPGQGSQKKGMGETLFEEFSEMTRQADDILGYSIKALCLNDKKKQLNQTEYTQPALYVVNAMSYLREIKETGNLPDFLAGHSLGEYNALQAAGAFSFEDGLRLVQKRGELMSRTKKGAMAAVLKLTHKEIRQCIEEHGLTNIDIANFNAPTEIVVSGLSEDIEKAKSHFNNLGALFIPLNTSGAFHSRYMDDAKSLYEKYLQVFKFNDLQIPVISNVHARPYQPDQIKRFLSDQINHSVKWTQSIQYLLEQNEMKFEELGVGNVLTKLVKKIESHFLEMKTDRKSEISSESEKNSQTNEIDEKIVVSSQAATDEIEVKPMQNKEDDVLNKKIIEWNNKYPVGAQVVVAGYEDKLKTRTKAMVLFGHRAAIYMQGYKGYFDLDDVTPIKISEKAVSA